MPPDGTAAPTPEAPAASTPAAPAAASTPAAPAAAAPAATPAAAPAAEPKPGEQPAAAAPAAAPAAEPKPGEATPAVTAPESYAEFKLPDGVTLNTELVTEFTGIAKELKLPQDQAQRVVDLGAKMAQKWATDQTAAIRTMQDGWAESVKTDKEIGGEKMGENLAAAKKALDAFGTPELNKMLDESGLGNHPEVLRAFWKIGRAISEDKLVPGQAPSGPSGLAALYPNSKHS